MFDLFDDLRRNRTSPSHVAQKFRDVFDRVRSTVREQKNGKTFGLISNRQAASSLLRLSRRVLLHEFAQALHVFDWSLRQNSMAEIENVPRLARSPAQNIFRPPLNLLPVGK